MAIIWTAQTCPKHEVVKLCVCGLNKICFTCGEGSGAYPCQCPKDEHGVRPQVRFILEQSLIKHADVFRELAEL